MSVFSRVGNLFQGSRVNGNIQEELQLHIEMRVADLIDSGMTPEHGRRAATDR
jgi:hypothetical protein